MALAMALALGLLFTALASIYAAFFATQAAFFSGHLGIRRPIQVVPSPGDAQPVAAGAFGN
jgi:hypothetical protein